MTVSRYLLAISLLLPGCSPKAPATSPALTANERALCDSLGIDTTIIISVREHNSDTLAPFRPANDEERPMMQVPPQGFVFGEQHAKSTDLVLRLKDDFSRKGYTIFVMEYNFGLSGQQDNMAVLKTTDKYAILKTLGTDGVNYSIDNDSLAAIVRQFDARYDLELLGAGRDWCEFLIRTEPRDWAQLAQEVYAVCPDVVDQGTETVATLAEEMKATKRLYFWWD